MRYLFQNSEKIYPKTKFLFVCNSVLQIHLESFVITTNIKPVNGFRSHKIYGISREMINVRNNTNSNCIMLRTSEMW